MAVLGTLSFSCLLFLTTALHGILAQSREEKCPQDQIQLIGKFTLQTLNSYGYPNGYSRNDDCWWSIQPAVNDDAYSLQLFAVDFDLNKTVDDCSETFVEILEGDTLANLAKVDKWCSSGPKVFTATKKIVALHFHSDSSQPGRGFSVDYSLIDSPQLLCEENSQGFVSVGPAPVIAVFKGQENVQSCQWKIHERNMNDDSRLVIELIMPSEIPCNLGRYILFEGESDSGHVNYEHCATSQPFSKIFLSSVQAVLKFQNDGVKDLSTDGFVVKISRREIADCDAHIDIPDQPVFFALPFSTTQGGESCPVHLETVEDGMQLRIDVLGSDETVAKCSDSLITVKGGGSNSNPVESFCMRKDHPVYFVDMNSAIVAKSSSASSIFLRATALSPECSTGDEEKVAVKDLVAKTKLPSSNNYRNLGRCVYSIKAESVDDVVYLKLKWTLPQEEMAYPVSDTGICEGDFLNVYDGKSSTSTLEYSSCSGSNGKRENVHTTVVSSQQYLHIVLDADEKICGESVELEYHSVPATQACKNNMLKVGRTSQVITSTNYPKPLPLNQRCLYDLVAENDDERIVVKVVDSNLPEQCETVLMLYEGGYQVEGKTRSETRICGKQRGTYKLQGQRASIISVSDDELSPGGWKIEVYTESGSGQQSKKGGDGNSGAWHKASLLWILCSLVGIRLLSRW